MAISNIAPSIIQTNINIISINIRNITIKRRNTINTISRLIHTEAINIITLTVRKNIITLMIYYAQAIVGFIITIPMHITTTGINIKKKKPTGKAIGMDIIRTKDITS